jgi:hypothetical protein
VGWPANPPSEYGEADRREVDPPMEVETASFCRFPLATAASDLSWSSKYLPYLGGAMKLLGRSALAAVATAGLMFVPSAPANAVSHKHCLYTPSPEGYVLIAQGVSEEAYDAESGALELFHKYVHRGEPSEQLTIVRIEVDEDCTQVLEVLPTDAVVV